jgi:hypothetical protein
MIAWMVEFFDRESKEFGSRLAVLSGMCNEHWPDSESSIMNRKSVSYQDLTQEEKQVWDAFSRLMQSKLPKPL